MTLHKNRIIFCLFLICLAPLFVIGQSRAEDKFPSGQITWVVPYAAGGGYDVYCRAVGKKMEEFLPGKANIIFKNVPAAAGILGANNVYMAKPDGNTIGVLSVPGHILNQKYGKVDYDVEKCSYIGTINADDYAILVAKESPYKTLEDLKKSNGLRFGSAGIGDPNHVYPLIASQELGFKIKGFVTYKGAPEAIFALIRGDVDAFCMAKVQYATFAKDTRVISIFGNKRWEEYPDIPTCAEQGYPQLAMLNLQRVVFGPPGVAPEIIKILEEAFWKAVTSDEVLTWAKNTNRPIAGSTRSEEAKKAVMNTFSSFAKYDAILRAEIKE